MSSRLYIDGERVKISSISGFEEGLQYFQSQIGGSEGEGVVKSEDAPITIKIRDQSENFIHFKVKKSTEMKKIFDAYASKLGVNPSNLRFLHDGEKIKDSDTPKMLELENDDQIDVLLEQVGGSEGTTTEVKSEGTITLRVKDQSGDEMLFKVKKTTEMSKVFDAYANRLGVTALQLKFMVDGSRINPTDTPKMLELEENDQIDVFLEQVGGSEGGEEKKPTGDDAVITVKLKDADNSEISFKVKKSTKMSKIIEAYASRKAIEARSFRILLDDGRRVHAEDTPKTLELDEDSVLSVVAETIGGC
jgi:small ubiquitin-related modifier